MGSFANRLLKARKQAHMTQEQLGFELDVTKSSVSAWENDREKPGFRVLEQLPALLGCSLDYLLGIDDARDRASDTTETYQAVNCARDQAESRLLVCFRALPAAKKKALLALLRTDT